MGFVVPAMMIASAAVSAYGAVQQGKAASDMANYRAQVARNNTILAEQNAGWAEAQGAAEESANAMKIRSGIGRLKAGMAASGVRVDEGSSADVLDSAEALGELDTLTIRSNTARKVYGYKVGAQSEESSAKLLGTAGENAETAGGISALSSALSSASSVGAKYAAWQNVAPKSPPAGSFGSSSAWY